MNKKTQRQAELLKLLDEIGKLTESMKARVSNGDADIRDSVKELDHLIHDLKASAGLTAFDRTAYQREYMRKKRAEDPDYRPIIEPIRDLPDWRKPPMK
ncbi:MAG: hypothetical protein A4E28_02696 [Methanocella sp. PtaU1.Bin125]|nr:MAG: hypothetical protein A4E28_02696 [Methanocella sp. PtaU1.Bin125]